MSGRASQGRKRVSREKPRDDQQAIALAFQKWESEFRREAKADKIAALQDCAKGLNLRVRKQLILDGTIQVILACTSYGMIDDPHRIAPFLAMQTYNPGRSRNAKYVFTFSLWRKAIARVLVGSEWEGEGLDLGDLCEHPWFEYEVCGFDRFCVTRVDRKPFSSRELKKIERLITNDLRFDYTEEELDIFFDYDEEAGDAFLVTVQDREGLET